MNVSSLASNVNATVWTDEWLQIIAANPTIPTDRDTMIGWFSNAIMTGYDEGYRRGVAATRVDKTPRR